MVIAVIDVGFYKVNSLSAFDSIVANNHILGTKDFVEPGDDVYTKGTHGSFVLSIIAGNIPGTYVGTAPNAIASLITFGQPSESDGKRKMCAHS